MKPLRFRKKLFLYYSLVMLVFILVAIFFFTTYAYQNLVSSSTESLEELSNKTANELEGLLNDMDQIALYVSTNPQVRDSFRMARFNGYTAPQVENEIGVTLTSFLVPNKTSKFRINIFNEDRIFVSIGVPIDRSVMNNWVLSMDYKTWYSTLPITHNKRSISSIYEDYLTEEAAPTLSVYREITDPDNIHRVIGIVEIQCAYSEVQEILSMKNPSFSCYAWNPDGEQIYPLGSQQPALQSLGRQILFEPETTRMSGLYKDNLYAAYHSDSIGILFMITQSMSSLTDFLKPVILTILVVASVMLCISLGLIFLIAKKTTEPLLSLTQAVNNVSMSNLSLQVSTENNDDEFVHLNEAFHEMFHRLEDSMQSVVELKSHEMRAHMIALQAQMDPHFLYNMLTIIKTISWELPENSIGDICDYLANMLRYNSTYKEDYVPLEKEVQHTEDYLKLMKIRYEDMFHYEIDIAPDILPLSILIPKLCLQPLVENCFQHGFKQALPPWDIKIRSWVNDGKWYLSVIDNGFGIRPDEIEQINQKVEIFLKNPSANLSELHLGGMGMVNTIVRLKLLYKDNITFEISHPEYGGTCILIGGTCNAEYIISGR